MEHPLNRKRIMLPPFPLLSPRQPILSSAADLGMGERLYASFARFLTGEKLGLRLELLSFLDGMANARRCGV